MSLVDNVPGSNKTWPADFTGLGLVLAWGGGEGGSSGQGLTKGGPGGTSGWLCIGTIDCVTGQNVTYTIGAGGLGANWVGNVQPGTPGSPTFVGGGTNIQAPGGGDTVTEARGRVKIEGVPALIPASGDWNGAKGGDAPSNGDYAGGQGGPSGNQGAGGDGLAPGGGGAGGGQAAGGDGGDGAPGGIVIIPATDISLPGYYVIGMDPDFTDFTPTTAGSSDWTCEGDGEAIFEAVGSGGGGKGGNGLQGGHGGSGGAWMWAQRAVFRGELYRRTLTAPGTGGSYNSLGTGSGDGTNGGDTTWAIAPQRAVFKQIASNVATIWTADNSGVAKRHGYLVGESVVIAGVDATFNGTYTITAVASDRLSFSYAKTASNVAKTAVTPAANQVTPGSPFVLAKGGNGATQNYYNGTPPTGGLASAGIPAGQGTDGGFGCRVQASAVVGSVKGGASGSGAWPLGGQAAWGGRDKLSPGGTGSSPGTAGAIPGAGGSGGAGNNGGVGGPGAIGGAIVRYILEQAGVWVDGERKSVTRWKQWSGGVGTVVDELYGWNAGSRFSLQKTLLHPESKTRPLPTYIKGASNSLGVAYDYSQYYDKDTGTFNWKEGIGTSILNWIASGDMDIVVLGDSVAEGWTSYDGVVTGVKDFPKAFPRIARDNICTATGKAKGGTGMIRPATVSGVDGMVTLNSMTAAGHYVKSNSTSDSFTLTTNGAAGQDSQGVQITGRYVRVAYSGPGITLRVNGSGVVATGPATANLDTVLELLYDVGSVGSHTIEVRPSTSSETRFFGISLEKPGIRVHNLAQGGAKAGGGTGQDFYGPATGMTTVDNMTFTYVQDAFVSSTKGGDAEVYMIFLGGNDSNQDATAATIKAAFLRIIDMIHAAKPNAKVVLMPDVWTIDRNVALMDICRDSSYKSFVAMIDLFYLSRGLTEIFGKGYNGDQFGHLNSTTGSPWAAAMMSDAFLLDPR